MESASSTIALCRLAKQTAPEISALRDEQINNALKLMAEALIENTAKILAENAQDIENSKGIISEVMQDRLRLTEDRIKAMASGILEIAALPSPLGAIIEEKVRPNGLKIEKVSVPFGVIAIIYESRPNVTSDAAALALKSGNVCILRGGKEAYRSAKAIVDALKCGLARAGISENAINLVSDTTRASATELMRANGLIDLLIPRGGAGLIRACVENATVPCLETGTGICHIYVDKDADLEMAVNILYNAKVSRPSVCNAAEVCLVHSGVAEKFLPLIKDTLCDGSAKSVTLKLDSRAIQIIDGDAASEADFDTEFLDYILAVKIVDSANEAIEHILAHSTHHSEAIITTNHETARAFTLGVDSAAVYVNASTRFTDGGEFGLGCEMGISTQKMHARGPLGIKELTTYKYIITGNGQTR